MSLVSKRTHLRVKPDIEDLCLIDLHVGGKFEPTIGAFIVNESPMKGCGLVIRTEDGIDVGMKVKVKLGKLSPLAGKVVWKRVLDSELIKIGIELLE